MSREVAARGGGWMVPSVAACVYTALAAVLGRDVLARLTSSIAHDAGDPLLTASILHWNAHHVPWTAGWWQFPIFDPTANALAFSEHLLGVSVIAAPLAWITGSPLAAYNVTLLLTFPLAAMAMYALVHYLAGRAGAPPPARAAGAFVAGLAYGFAPYRMATLPHIQMLASFWAPLALLGLHAYLDSRAVRLPPSPRGDGGSRAPATAWLVLFGAAWALQAAANAYMLVLFSTFVGLWVLWFVVARRQWQALAAIAGAGLAAFLPLAPIVYTYLSVHAEHGFERDVGEMRAYSADVAAVLCAPSTLTFWGWLRVACRAEGELFPGLVVVVLFVAAAVTVLRARSREDAGAGGSPAARSHREPLGRRVFAIVRGLLLAAGCVYALIVASVLVIGPWEIDAGILRVSASGADKPLLVALFTGLAALLLSLARLATGGRGAVLAFYLFAAFTSWLLALGPTVTLLGESSGRPAPFSLLLPLPGVDGLRVPARFWLLTVLSLAVVAGLYVARVLSSARPRAVRLGALGVASLIAADGWIAGIPAQPPPADVPDAAALRGRVVLQLPVDPFPDIASTWRAVIGGWRTINGYSGYHPNYYQVFRHAAHAYDETLFTPFRRRGDVYAVVADTDATARGMVARQPGAVLLARGGGASQFRLPRLASAAVDRHGASLRVVAVEAPCAPDAAARLVDGDERTLWECRDPEEPAIVLDLGRVHTVGSVVYGLGRFSWNPPGAVTVETSPDGVEWSVARSGSARGAFIEGGLASPRSLHAVLPFAAREGRYVRIRAEGLPPDGVWWVAELDVRAP